MQHFNHIAVIGAGAWGTALAQMLAAQNRPAQKVTLYARDPELALAINEQHENKKYLPGCALSPDLAATADLAATLAAADMLVMATPAQHFAATMAQATQHARPGTPVINTAKGISIETGERLSQIAARMAPQLPYGVLSGPSFAHEVAHGLPTAVTLATAAAEDDAQSWLSALSGPAFRPYLSPDVVGAEYGGALKNVIAIACGVVQGRRLGENARAAVMIRGMAEITRLAVAAGAQEHTFLGLAGMGDLVLTCNSMSSRNFSLGAALGQGQTLAEVMQTRVTVAEGVATARAVAAEAKSRGIDMPICGAVDALLHHGAALDDIIHGLLTRALKNERG